MPSCPAEIPNRTGLYKQYNSVSISRNYCGFPESLHLGEAELFLGGKGGGYDLGHVVTSFYVTISSQSVDPKLNYFDYIEKLDMTCDT